MNWYLTKQGRIVQGNAVLDRRQKEMGLVLVENPHKKPEPKKRTKKTKSIED